MRKIDVVVEDLPTQEILSDGSTFDVPVIESKEILVALMHSTIMPKIAEMRRKMSSKGFDIDIGCVYVSRPSDRLDFQDPGAAKLIRSLLIGAGFEVSDGTEVVYDPDIPEALAGPSSKLSYMKENPDSFSITTEDLDKPILIAPVYGSSQRTSVDSIDSMKNPEKCRVHIDFSGAVLIRTGDFIKGEDVPADGKIRNKQVVEILTAIISGH